MLKKGFIKLNNSIFKLVQRKPLLPENILLLFPHCLQASDCKQNILKNLDNCLRCGRCKVGDLLKLRDEFKVACIIAGGGRQAVQIARESWVKGIVAVACEKELFEGILATAPKPVFAIFNSQPFGFCKHTDVEIAKIRQAILKILKNDQLLPLQSNTL